METIAKVIGFSFKMQIVNVFDHWDAHDNKWKGICGMVSSTLL